MLPLPKELIYLRWCLVLLMVSRPALNTRQKENHLFLTSFSTRKVLWHSCFSSSSVCVTLIFQNLFWFLLTVKTAEGAFRKFFFFFWEKLLNIAFVFLYVCHKTATWTTSVNWSWCVCLGTRDTTDPLTKLKQIIVIRIPTRHWLRYHP